MKKRYILPLMGAVATVGIGYLMKNKNQNNLVAEPYNASFVNAGIPDQIDSIERDQLENAKMVSEGSQFGVQYFNEAVQEDREYLSQQVTK